MRKYAVPSTTCMVRGSRFIPNLTKACAEICTACAEECSSHGMDHCNKCAQACREAVEEYNKIAAVAA